MTTILATAFNASSWLLAQAATPSPYVGSPGHGAIGHNIIWTVLIGLVIGVIAKFLTPGRDPGGCIITSLIGIGGSFVAWFIGSIIGLYKNGDTPGFIMSVVGAVILLALYHAFIGRKNV